MRKFIFILILFAVGNCYSQITVPTTIINNVYHSDSIPERVDSLKIGDVNSYVKITNKGITLYDSATVWNDIRVSGSQLRSGTSAPTLVVFGATGNLRVWQFNGSSTPQEVEFEIQMPHDWKIGSTISPHVHWSPSDGSTGNVQWNLEYSIASINGTFTTGITPITGVGACTGAWKHLLTELPDIDMSSYTGVSVMLICRLFRDPTITADTYGQPACLLEFDIHYEINSLGSNSEYVK